MCPQNVTSWSTNKKLCCSLRSAALFCTFILNMVAPPVIVEYAYHYCFLKILAAHTSILGIVWLYVPAEVCQIKRSKRFLLNCFIIRSNQSSVEYLTCDHVSDMECCLILIRCDSSKQTGLIALSVSM